MACRDIAKKRWRNLESFHERSTERRALDGCPKCGRPAHGAAACQSCRDAALRPLRSPPGRRWVPFRSGANLSRACEISKLSKAHHARRQLDSRACLRIGCLEGISRAAVPCTLKGEAHCETEPNPRTVGHGHRPR